MRNVRCADCDEYRNEWCEKVIDSPHPDMIRDCQYWHERKDLVGVIRCKDCKHRYVDGDGVRYNVCDQNHNNAQSDDWFCADAERREQDERI